MNTNRTSKLLIIAVSALVFCIIVVVGMWYLIGQKGQSLKSDMQTVRDKEELQREQQKLEGILAETEEERNQLRNHILEGEDGAVALLSLIDEIAAELGIELETKKLEVIPSESGSFDTLEVVLNMEGRERSVIKALQLLELVPYRSEVVNLSTTRNEDGHTGAIINQTEVTLYVSIIKT